MRLLIAAGAAAMSLAGCSTTPGAPPTAEQVQFCQKMLAMGEGATHSHSAEKMGGQSQMAMTHAQCRRMLARQSPS